MSVLSWHGPLCGVSRNSVSTLSHRAEVTETCPGRENQRILHRSSSMEKPSRGGEKRTAVWASHPEDRGSDDVIAPPYVTTGWSLIAGECVIGATPRGQPRMPAMR